MSGRVRVTFGRRKHARFDTYTLQNGIEIDASADTPVRAVHEGTVVFADLFRGYGLMVVVDHGGKHHTLYAHLGDTRVANGQRVAAGQEVGTAGRSLEGSGLYFEVRFQGKPEDPTEWLDARRRNLRGSSGIIGDMTPRGRLVVALVTTALLGYMVVGSVLGLVIGDTTYGQLSIFNEVVRLVIDAYVEPVNLDRAMAGARLGLTEALDGDTAYLDAEDFRPTSSLPRRTRTPTWASCSRGASRSSGGVGARRLAGARRPASRPGTSSRASTAGTPGRCPPRSDSA